MIYNALAKGGYRVPGVHDKDSKRLFGLIFRPDTWTTATVYSKREEDDYDIVIPSVFTGLYYRVAAPGLSGALDPAWATTVGAQTTDGAAGLVWEAVAYNLMPVSESIASVIYSASNDVILSATANTAISCQFMIEPLADAAIAAGNFEVTCHMVKNNAEEFDVTLRFRVGTR